MLTVGIVTAMGIASTTNADTVSYGGNANTFTVKNVATGTYNVTGNDTQQKVESNEVTINVAETGSFSLVTTGGSNVADDVNDNIEINPTKEAKVDFIHVLKNEGNVTDNYNIAIKNEGGDQFDYNLAGSTIIYQKLDSKGELIASSEVVIASSEVVIANGGTTPELAPGESARITINAAVDSTAERVIGNNGILTVTAKSKYLSDRGDNSSATNTDNAITTTPIYAITKSARTNLGTKVIDSNNDNAYVDYTISVENQGNADGTNVTIEDILPDGLVAIQANEPNYIPPTTTGGSSNVNPSISADGRTITVSNQNIDQRNTITVKFRVKKASNATASSNFVNYAVVKDDLNGDGVFDLIDSSGDAADKNVKENNYENLGNAAVGRDNNTDATVTPKNQNRNISITDDADKELALQSKGNGFTYTITNNGTDITEANAAGEIIFTVATTKTDVDSINIGRVFVDANGNGVVDEGETILTAKNGQYDLFDAVGVEGLIPSQSVNIGVEIVTNGSGSNKDTDSDVGKSEEITITISPKTEVDGTPALADIFANSITTLQGIELYKFQASASCNTVPTRIPNASWTKSVVIAPADQCAFYKLEATNTFTNNTVITNLVLQDILANTLIYQPDSFSSTTSLNSTAATPAISSNTIGGTFSSLAGKETGTIYFSAKISQTGQNKSAP